jgi:hypothetical protein
LLDNQDTVENPLVVPPLPPLPRLLHAIIAASRVPHGFAPAPYCAGRLPKELPDGCVGESPVVVQVECLASILVFLF